MFFIIKEIIGTPFKHVINRTHINRELRFEFYFMNYFVNISRVSVIVKTICAL